MRNNSIYAKELLKKMTLTEKVAQLSQTFAGYRCYQRNGDEFSFGAGLRKKLCKQYLTKLDKAKITGISLI